MRLVLVEKLDILSVLEGKAVLAYRKQLPGAKVLKSNTRKLGYAEGRYLTEAKIACNGKTYGAHVEWTLDSEGRGSAEYFLWNNKASEPIHFFRQVRVKIGSQEYVANQEERLMA